jgi:hypothetical protein
VASRISEAGTTTPSSTPDGDANDPVGLGSVADALAWSSLRAALPVDLRRRIRRGDAVAARPAPTGAPLWRARFGATRRTSCVCRVTASPVTIIRWRKGTRPSRSTSRADIRSSSALRLPAVGPSPAGAGPRIWRLRLPRRLDSLARRPDDRRAARRPARRRKDELIGHARSMPMAFNRERLFAHHLRVERPMAACVDRIASARI